MEIFRTLGEFPISEKGFSCKTIFCDNKRSLCKRCWDIKIRKQICCGFLFKNLKYFIVLISYTSTRNFFPFQFFMTNKIRFYSCVNIFTPPFSSLIVRYCEHTVNWNKIFFDFSTFLKQLKLFNFIFEAFLLLNFLPFETFSFVVVHRQRLPCRIFFVCVLSSVVTRKTSTDGYQLLITGNFSIHLQSDYR